VGIHRGRMEQLEGNCKICGETCSGERTGFLIAEDPWQDTLRISHWDEHLAAKRGVYAACNRIHLKQLIVHWMVLGSVGYPFAMATGWDMSLGMLSTRTLAEDSRYDGSGFIGELAVHRESMRRVLSENPDSLRTILDALMHAAQPEFDETESHWNPEWISVPAPKI
jgi:hypothetical protein